MDELHCSRDFEGKPTVSAPLLGLDGVQVGGGGEETGTPWSSHMNSRKMSVKTHLRSDGKCKGNASTTVGLLQALGHKVGYS